MSPRNPFKIGLIELYHPYLHGSTDEHVQGHYLVIDTFTNYYPVVNNPNINNPNINNPNINNPNSDGSTGSDDDAHASFTDASFPDASFDEDNFTFVNMCIRIQRLKYHELNHPRHPFKSHLHSILRNYHTIIQRKTYIQPQIIQCVYLRTGECVAVVKTFWIKCIQRAWKKVYKQRQYVWAQRGSIASLRYREIHGRWPPIDMPGIHGLLRNTIVRQ